MLNSGLRQNRDGILHINHPTLKTLSKPSNSVNSLNLTNCSMFFSYFELNLPSLDISPNFGSPCILCVGLLERVSSLCLCVYDCFWPFSIMVLVWLLSRFDTLSHSVGRVLARTRRFSFHFPLHQNCSLLSILLVNQDKNSKHLGWWQHTPLISALRKQRQFDLCEFEANLVYKVSSRTAPQRNPVSKKPKQLPPKA